MATNYPDEESFALCVVRQSNTLLEKLVTNSFNSTVQFLITQSSVKHISMDVLKEALPELKGVST